ncbi:glycosyltransferase [Carboxylicivirga taeanensis]|uniref:glycosyltransferase n=1 Tax=Carboxylicivirga taeanensis TaxID=1416875 RepID=UPI003F6E32DE
MSQISRLLKKVPGLSRQSHKKKCTIVTVSELATDYRLHKLSFTLEEAGYSCDFICRIKDNHLPYTGKHHVYYLNTIWQNSPLFYLIYNLRIFFFLLFHKTNLIVSVDLDTLTGCSLAKLCKKTQLLFDSHEYFPESPEISQKPWIKNIWFLAEKLFIPIIDIGVTVCQSIADIYLKKYNKDFLVIRNAPIASEIQNIKKVPKEQHPFKILYQGAVNNGRALKELVKAMSLIEEAQLLIVGDGDIFDEINALAKPMRSKIELIGKVPFTELRKYTLQADLGIALLENAGLNNYYALPNRLFDALHAELPMLGINFPEIKTFIESHDYGMTIDSIEPEVIARTINKLKANPQQLMKWRHNARVTKKHVNWENESKELYLILTRL